MPLPALKILDKEKHKPEPSPPKPLGVGDVFDLEEQKRLYRAGVEALRYIAENGNDNARTGAAAKLVDLFKKNVESSAQPKKKRVLVSWRDPTATVEEDELLA